MSSITEKTTVTSALPYIHGVPHLGNIVGSILPADIFHRYLDLKGEENRFICGSDVHGTPLELEAIERGMPVEKLAEKQNKKVQEILEEFEMDFSIYSNTHSDYNRKQTHDMFEELYCSGYIQEKKQNLPYCLNDERFLPDRYIEGECPHCGGLARGDQCDDCGKLVEPEEIIEPECQICSNKDIEFRDTKHLFLDLPQFKDELKEWLENADNQPVPDSKLEEVRNAIEDTEKRCITRDINWGFEIPAERVNKRIENDNLKVDKLDEETYEDKVLYVWFDAPIGYIGFTRELFDDGEEWKDYWASEDTDVYYSIGKDNTIFHTVIWPSMLIGSSNDKIEYNLPHYEFIQEFLLAEDTKFSKSRGKGLSTEDALEMYPADYWRFYLSKKMPQGQDTKFSWSDFESEINNVLNDTVGNFVNRTLALTEKWFDNTVPEAELEGRDEEVIEKLELTLKEYEEEFEDHNMREALDRAIEVARIGDRYLSEEEPWNNEKRREEVILVSVKAVKALGAVMYPFTPEASEKIGDMLNTEYDISERSDQVKKALKIEEGHDLGEREQLFEKIDVEDREEQEEEDNTMENVKKFNEDTVSFEEFGEMDMRVGKIVSVEDHPNADRLYKVRVNVGEAELQTCAGLKNHYEPEELEGKRVIVLANLEPAELRGEKSECMMLAAEDEEGNVSLLTTDMEIREGSEVE